MTLRPRTALAVVAAALGPAVALPAVADAGSTSHATGRLLVTIRGGDASPHDTTTRVDAALASRGSAARATETLGKTAAVPVAGAAERAALRSALAGAPDVAQVVDEQRAVTRSLPDDPVLRDRDTFAPSVPQAWWAAKLRLPQAWDVANGAGTTVAVIDTGFDLSHPQLAPVVDRAATSKVAPLQGTARTDEQGHGTHVASLACSAFNDGSGTVGAGGRCRLVTFKSDLEDLSVARAVRRATGMHVDAIVMSFGSDGKHPASLALRRALQDAAAKGVVLVAAAADDERRTTEQGWPANVLQPTGTGPDRDAGIGLTVTAATAAGRRASYAGTGTQISVAGYGSYAESGGPPGILGAFPATSVLYEQIAYATRTTVRGDPRYAYEKGTSSATPMVAGVAALVRSANPELSAADVIGLLKRTARRPAGWTSDLGWGIVDARAAVDAGRRLDRRAPTATFSTTARTVRSASGRLAWRGTDRSPEPEIPSGLRTVELWRSVDGARFRKVGGGRRGLTTAMPRGTVRFVLRAVDRAGNRAPLATKKALTLERP